MSNSPPLSRRPRRVLAVIVAVCAASHANELSKTAFTVSDSIELTRVLPFASEYQVNPVTETALFSPDGSRFLIRSRRGDLKKNVNVEALLLFRTSDIEAYLSAENQGERPASKILVQLDIAVDWAEMSHIQWLNETEVGFIAQGNNGWNQAFTLDVESGDVSQLTHGERNVASFIVSGDKILFYAHTSATESLVSPVDRKNIYDVIIPDGSTDTPMELFQASRSTGSVQRIDAPAVRLRKSSRQIWLSPAGDYAVTFAPAINAPGHWADYNVPSCELFGYTPDRVSSDPTSWALALRTRYQLIDLKSNSAKPLLDAPSGELAQNLTPREVFWPQNGYSVVVSNTYLPVEINDQKIRNRRAQQPAIAEVDLQSGDVTAIVWEGVRTDEQRAAGQPLLPIISIDWNGRSNLLTVAKTSASGDITYEGFRKKGNIWRTVKVKASGEGDTALGGPAIDLRQSLNERPKVYATGGKCACRKVLFDPNPQADHFLFGWAEIFKWTDRNRTVWQGGLIYPPGYVSGERYPLVVQTHGFEPSEYLIDGPDGGTTAMAAQALANVGFVVLQAEDNRQAFTSDEREGPLFAEGLRSAIEQLISQGIADDAMVGLISFSRTGYHALHLLAQNPNLLAAATISDALQQGYMSDLLLTNYSVDSAVQIRKLSGGAPNIANIGEWFSRNPLYKLPQINTAIRLEANGPSSVLGMWETYTVLHNAGRPVDFIYFPRGSHVLRKPAERIGSQGGNVDWFRFWLQNYENPDPAKAEQYSRWRKLRDQRDALSVTKQPVQ